MATHFDIICVSHLRWDFVYQRPQHLLSRAARERRVIFFEEPIFEPDVQCHLRVRRSPEAVTIATPVLRTGISPSEATAIQQNYLSKLARQQGLQDYVLWLYTPMALSFTRHLDPIVSVYDCMDELAAFRGAPPELPLREAELFDAVDLVFTGGYSLFHAKRHRHPNVKLFPSAVDFAHFAAARTARLEMPSQAAIPHPRIGYFGVIDERMNLELLAEMADRRPDFHFVMIGPVAKIDHGQLPLRANIRWMGPRPYSDLPGYLAGWDVAMLPFALNESTRFISPTKTPEYLAAGKPVVSTSIRDVVHPYGEQGLVRIADTAEGFEAAIDAAINEDQETAANRIAAGDRLLTRLSWDRTWTEMYRLVSSAIEERRFIAPLPPLTSRLERPVPATTSASASPATTSTLAGGAQ